MDNIRLIFAGSKGESAQYCLKHIASYLWWSGIREGYVTVNKNIASDYYRALRM